MSECTCSFDEESGVVINAESMHLQACPGMYSKDAGTLYAANFGQSEPYIKRVNNPVFVFIFIQ